ncbi:MAG: putative P-loop ATPase [Cyclobacteriaceae bacterium]|jgi:predicted P-loop ATPase
MPKIDRQSLKVGDARQMKKKPSRNDFSDLKPPEKIKILFENHLTGIMRNQITGEWEVNGQTLTEESVNSHLLEFQIKTSGITEPLMMRYMKSNNITSYNPIHAFFSENEKLKPEGKIAELASTIETDTGMKGADFSPRFVEIFLTKWMVGCVAQAHGRGVNPLMLILAGTKQNTGKTSWFRSLTPDPLNPYFAEPKGLSEMRDADLGMLLTENLIVLDDEMSGRTWKDFQRMKSMLSMSSFTMRRPYDKRQRKYPRLASMCATNNNLDLLGDPTGNRRLIPINVLSIDHKLYNSIDKTELWMEAYHLMMDGYDHNLKQDDIKLLNECTRDFETVDEIIELISEYFLPPGEGLVGRMTATQVAQVIMRYSLFKGIHPNRIGERLRKMGYEQKRDNATGARTWIIQLQSTYNQP